MISERSLIVSVRRGAAAALLVACTLVGAHQIASPAFAEPGVPGAPSKDTRDVERQRKKLAEAGQRAMKERAEPGRGREIPATNQEDPIPALAAIDAPKLDGEQPAQAPAPQAPQAQAPNAPAADPAKPQAPSDGPRIEWENPSHDWGTVMDSKPLVCSFKFKNVGNQKLVIGNINTGCGCTVANLVKKEFEPGEGAAIDITFSPKGSGKNQRAVTVQTNDPRMPNAQLVIAANVVPLVEARPNNVQFGQIAIGEERVVEIVIVSRDPKMQVKGISVNGPEMTATLVDRKPAQMIEPELPGRAVIDVKLGAGAPVGRLLRLISITVEAKSSQDEAAKVEEIRVNAFASIQGELAIEPAFIRVHPLVAGEAFEREVTVTRVGGKPFKLEKVEIANSTLKDSSVTFEPTTVGTEQGYKIKLKGKAGDTANNFRGAIVLHTDLEREKTTEVQFSGIVRVGNPAAPTASTAPSSPTGTTPSAPVNKP